MRFPPLILSVCLLFLSQQSIGQELKTWEHPVHHFVIDLPTTWAVHHEKMEPVVLFALSAQEGEEDQFLEYVSVALESTKGKTREEFLELYKQSLINDLPGLTFEDQDSREVNKVQMDRWVFTFNSKNQQLKTRAFLMVLSDKGYIISCTAPAKDFDRYNKLFNQITASFEFQAKPSQ